MICCTPLPARPYEAIDHTTITTLYFLIMCEHEPVASGAAFGLFLILYKKSLRTVVAVAVLLFSMDACAAAASLGYVLILFYKPCDVYTVAVIASVLIELFIVTVRLVVFNVLLSLF